MLTKFLRAAAGQAPSSPTDPDFNSVSLLLHGDGTNGSQNNTFLDSSTNNLTVTRFGNTTQGTFNPFLSSPPYSPSVNGGSLYFDGSDYLSVATSTTMDFGTGDFTVEFWVYHLQSGTAVQYADQNVPGFSLSRNTANQFELAQANVALLLTTTGTIPINSWVHLAATRSGTTARLFINGVSSASGTVTNSFATSSPWVIGRAYSNASNFMNGYISNYRLVKGTAVYTSNFTPPTAPLTPITNTSLLLSGTNAGIFDNAIKNNLETVGNAQVNTSVVKFGTGSIVFNGNIANYLSSPSSAGFAFGTGNFTVEYWVYPISFSTSPTVFDTRSSLSSQDGYSDFFSSSGVFNLFIGNSGIYSSATAVPTNAWTYIAVTRSGTSIRVFFNGVQNGSTVTNSTNMTNTTCLVGINKNILNPFNGYIDDLRITKGVARYTANFTPPTAAFPNS